MKILLKTCLLLLTLSIFGNALGVETIICPATHENMPLTKRSMDFPKPVGICTYIEKSKGSCTLRYYNVRELYRNLWVSSTDGFICDASPEKCAFQTIDDKPSKPEVKCNFNPKR